ncbi:Testicular acid phosphatase-like protein [Aphelenchoides besseyi]|nr:Testicular acid phosphatase-like protein [Aphelenchoides besseyi]
MMMRSFIIILSLCVSVTLAEPKLKFVQAIWRHGARAPGSLPYPNDKNGEDKWTRGWNQLTNDGMRQLKDLGQFFRHRYAGHFLNRTYNVKEIAVLSSDKERALVSAQSMLYGLFPPASHERFEEHLPWHPIPVHSNGYGAEDPLLKPTKFACPRFDEKVKKVREKFSTQLFSKYSDFFDYLKKVTGYQQIGLDELKTLSEIGKEIEQSLPQPDWVHKKWPKYQNKTTVELITALALEERLTRLSKQELSRLRGGFLLGDWLKRAEKVVKRKQKKPRKMLLYSSHDGTLQSFLHVLGVADGIQIPYAGCVIMEIYDDQTVKLLFRHGHKLSPLKVKGCGEKCKVEKLVSVLEERAIFSLKKLHKECGREFCSEPKPVEVKKQKKKWIFF